MRGGPVASKLELLLDSIHPSRIIDETERRVDASINAFPFVASSVTTWEEFRSVVGSFCVYVENNVLGRGAGGQISEAERGFGWGRVSAGILSRAYGPSGDKAAFEMARTGHEGGLFAVLREVGRRMAEDYAKGEIAARVAAYWHSLTPDEQIAAGQEYLRTYRELLPSELTEGSAARIRGSFWKVLEEHPWALKRLRRVGRS